MTSHYSRPASAAFALFCGLALSSTAIAGVVTTLGSPTSTDNTIGDLPSWNGNGDQQDVTFTTSIDFSRNNGASGQQVIWETGGPTTGSSLVYGANNTLYLRVREGGSIADLSWKLTSGQLNAGELFVSWVVDLGNDEVRLMMNGLDAPNRNTTVASAAFTGTGWSDAGDAGFGTGNGTGLVGGYSGPGAFVGADFVSGTINTTTGLNFYNDQALLVSPVPEPLGVLAGVAAVGFTCFRRRRNIA